MYEYVTDSSRTINASEGSMEPVIIEIGGEPALVLADGRLASDLVRIQPLPFFCNLTTAILIEAKTRQDIRSQACISSQRSEAREYSALGLVDQVFRFRRTDARGVRFSFSLPKQYGNHFIFQDEKHRDRSILNAETLQSMNKKFTRLLGRESLKVMKDICRSFISTTSINSSIV